MWLARRRSSVRTSSISVSMIWRWKRHAHDPFAATRPPVGPGRWSQNLPSPSVPRSSDTPARTPTSRHARLRPPRSASPSWRAALARSTPRPTRGGHVERIRDTTTASVLGKLHVSGNRSQQDHRRGGHSEVSPGCERETPGNRGPTMLDPLSRKPNRRFLLSSPLRPDALPRLARGRLAPCWH